MAVEKRKAQVAKARRKHHQTQKQNELSRCDTYVTADTDKGLNLIKARYSLANKGQAIDKAVELALILLDND